MSFGGGSGSGNLNFGINSGNSNTVGAGSGSGGTSLLETRLSEKKRELENLLQLQQLSGDLVKELQVLAGKLDTLADGTEAVAAVLQNWGNIIRAVTLASCK